MTPAAGSLLGLLGSGARLIGGAVSGRAPIEGASFEDLLERAGAGRLREAAPVRLAPGVSLSAEQIERVTEAAGRLEAGGASRGVILIDDRALEFDVLTREVTREIDLSAGQVASGVDAIVRAAEPQPQARLTAPSTLGAQSRSLLDALSRG